MATNPAKVTVTGTPENPVFNFELPSGAKGERGTQGPQGIVGPTPQLKLGEVNTVANPSDQEWIAGMIRKSPVVTAALTETFPSTMKGDKGDPGGIVAPTISYSGDDANKYTTPGTVYQTSGSTLALNWPIAGKGHLFVIGTAGTIQQIFYPLIPIASSAARVSYTRVQLSATTWSPWAAYAAQRIDNTAGRTIYTWDDTNNREQLIYGDTGWRDISALIPKYKTGKVYFRRTDGIGHFLFEGAFFNVTAEDRAVTIPISGTGATLSGYTTLGSGLNYPGAHAFQYNYAGTNHQILVNTNLALPVSGYVTFPIRDSWPTTLPGVAIGGVIPYN